MQLKVTLATVLGTLALAAGGAFASPSTFAHAYQGVMAGSQATARADGLRFERAADGSVMTVDELKIKSAVVTPQSDDITTKQVEGNLASDIDVKASRVHVDSNNGVVALSGNVSGPRAAETAIRLALNTEGVTAVSSRLTWNKRR
jgi:osmotically-inducible protein OsmY